MREWAVLERVKSLEDGIKVVSILNPHVELYIFFFKSPDFHLPDPSLENLDLASIDVGRLIEG